MSKILVKQAPAVQQFQQLGDDSKRPTLGRLARRAFGRGGTGEVGTEAGPTMAQRAGAGLGLLGKLGAMAATGVQTAHSLQGGNVGAPFGAALQYQGLDPTTQSNLQAMGFNETAKQGLASPDNNMIQGPTLPVGHGQEFTATMNPSPAMAGKTTNLANDGTQSVPLPTTPTPTPPAPAPAAPVTAPATAPATAIAPVFPPPASIQI